MTEEEMDFTDAQTLRKRAEELVKNKKENTSPPEIELFYKKLLFELNVKQTELELQNEALRQANETAEAALKKYTMLFDLAAMGYFLLEPDGTICELNFTGADMLREKRITLKGSSFKLFISEESKAAFNDFFKKAYKSNAMESCKINLGYDGNPFCMVYMEGIVTEGEKNCLLSVVNLSKLKHAV
ncbi:MAG: hypothetical protein ACOC2E_03005 [Bacteroidota bacterium]